MTTDNNKNITGISYNHLNLPVRVNVNGGTEYMSYVYDATGTKLKKIATTANGKIFTEYAGNYVYKNSNLEFFSHSEGIVEHEADGYKYVYQFKDHLGNIRLSYKDANKDGTVTKDEIVQEKNYYPFGLQHQGYNFAVNGRKHNYGYNGTEHEENLGLNLYEMDLRQYDPSIARWTAIDPIDHISQSTYNGFDNNPIYWADPSGAEVEKINGGVRYTGEHAQLAFGALQKQYGSTDPKKKKKKKATVTTEDPVAYAIDNDGEFDSGTPDFIRNGNFEFQSNTKGTLEEHNAKWGTNYTADNLGGQLYYRTVYAPQREELMYAMYQGQKEAAEYVSYILPMGGGIRGAAGGVKIAGKGINWLSKAFTKFGIQTHVLGNRALNFAKTTGYKTINSSVRNASFGRKRNIVRFGGNRIKSTIQGLNSINDIMNVKTFDNVIKWRKLSKDVWKFGKGMYNAL
jgi:RHS repeat-associated protein